MVAVHLHLLAYGNAEWTGRSEMFASLYIVWIQKVHTSATSEPCLPDLNHSPIRREPKRLLVRTALIQVHVEWHVGFGSCAKQNMPTRCVLCRTSAKPFNMEGVATSAVITTWLILKNEILEESEIQCRNYTLATSEERNREWASRRCWNHWRWLLQSPSLNSCCKARQRGSYYLNGLLVLSFFVHIH